VVRRALQHYVLSLIALAACGGTEGDAAPAPPSSAPDASVDAAPAEGDAGGDASTPKPPPDFTVNGQALDADEKAIIEVVAKDVVPVVPGANRDERVMLAAQGSWWALKEGVWGLGLPDVYAYSNCNTTSGDERIGPLESCAAGRAWQVGIAAVQVPNHDLAEVEGLAKQLYPQRTSNEILGDVAKATGLPQATQDSIVASTGSLRTSWLLRVPAIGFAAVVPGEVVPECVEGSKSWCFGSGWDETKKFAATKDDAAQSIEDLRRILDALAP
jgi:hypothetical protein